MSHLTVEQFAAIKHPGNLLLTACPGSGKTRTLIAKLVTEVEDVRDSPRALCCITYTNSAVQEIERRAREQLLAGDDRFFSISTIHSFCLNEIVRPYGWLMPGFKGTAKILTRENEDFESICRYAVAQAGGAGVTREDYDAFESIGVDADGQLIGMAAENRTVKAAAPHFWARCTELGYTDFGSIIYVAYQLLRDKPQIAKSLGARYKWFLVDEFQDTTSLQIEILKLLHASGRSSFFCVGDIAQSIFAFAGARPELVQPFGEHIGAETRLSLSENFRSSQRIVSHAEKLFPRFPPMVASGPNKDFALMPDLVRGGSVFDAITKVFLPRAAAAGIAIGDCTVLAKDWNSLYNLGRLLRAAHIPIVGPGARPYRRSRLFAHIAEQLCFALTSTSGKGSRQLERALFHTVQDLTGYGTDVFSHGGRVVLIRLLREAYRLSQVSNGAIAWLDQMSIRTGEILRDSEFVSDQQAKMLYASVQEMKADMQKQNADLSALTIDDLGIFADSSNALHLSTIHYAKGREYEAVAIIGMKKGTFPHFKATDIEAEKRQFYVGVTRAKKFLMYVCETDRFNNPPSPFLGSMGVQMLP
ncbi:UvrD-helicase domain-containing protein [Pseudomonas sp. GM80]|uniref:UvrD-helicase domain-containing protein n=1 Tax=Pseudomonas sp. GM80 TaxID=1144339 RepID=UPI00026F4E4E|nr:ATP-dependent helicase [Pseudomonas sp. GM80]EJN34420.1 DNA/RNA helicase, superfamily I [Pseudomonas sp. GM80]